MIDSHEIDAYRQKTTLLYSSELFSLYRRQVELSQKNIWAIVIYKSCNFNGVHVHYCTPE